MSELLARAFSNLAESPGLIERAPAFWSACAAAPLWPGGVAWHWSVIARPNHRKAGLRSAQIFILGALLAMPLLSAVAQDRLKLMPGYGQYQKMSRETADAFKSGALSVNWTEGGKAFEFDREGKRFRCDVASRKTAELPPPKAEKSKAARSTRPPGRTQAERPARGRQHTSAVSSNGQWRAFYRDRNLWLSATNSTNAIAITTEGNEKTRIKCGTASWVYGEELYQTTAIWWSPDSKKIAFYRFDESQVPDFYLTINLTKVQSALDVEPYPKAGTTNPMVDVLIYDMETKQTVTVDARDGRPFDNSVLGHYLYGVSWTQDSKELLFHRTNRRQNIMELAAADPQTGKCRVVVREEWPPSWTENLPEMKFLKDGQRFIWASERTGWKNYYLCHLDGRLLATLTRHAFEVAGIVRLDEAAGQLHYLARSGDNPMKFQLHRVGLDGAGDRRLTDPAFHHQISFAPDGRHFIDVAQTHDFPPVTWLMDAEGRFLAELARSDVRKLRRLGFRPVELLQFNAADGKTGLYGMLHYPSDFTPYRSYPLLVSVYAGPATSGARETFTTPNLLTEHGFLVASFDSRSANGRGKRFLDAIYMKLGMVEMDDQAAGVRSLWSRGYVNKERVGIFGTSYGGTASATCLLRFPEVFQAACAASAVTDYRNYDTIYTERYLWIPQENKAGYDNASVLGYANRLKGRLMLFYGTADDNVHPNNTLQLISALQKAGKSFEVQVGPDLGHTSPNRDRMLEFFIENLALR
jgi:dipeptidyl-peptidase-4